MKYPCSATMDPGYCACFSSPALLRDSIFEIPLNDGVSRTLWDSGAWTNIWDWSDGSLVLFVLQVDHPDLRVLDVKSLTTMQLIGDSEYSIWQDHFSHDGRWITFNAARGNLTSRVFAIPFKKTLMPRSEWIPITDGTWDDKPRFSADDKIIYFASTRDGSFCLYGQRITPEMHPEGEPFPVFHSHERRRRFN